METVAKSRWVQRVAVEGRMVLASGVWPGGCWAAAEAAEATLRPPRKCCDRFPR